MVLAELDHRRVNGRARTFDASHTHTLAVEWGATVGPVGPLGDGGNGSGFEMATSYTSAVSLGLDRNMLAAAVNLGDDPQDQIPLTDPFPAGYEGQLWGITLATVIESGLYQFPPELADAGYTLQLGFATLDVFGGTTLTSVDYPLTTGANAETDSLMTIGVGALSTFTVTTALVDDVNAGVKVPYVGLDGPYSGRNPLLLLADMVLTINGEVAGVVARTPVTRQFPRDDGLGILASGRSFPAPKRQRVFGGYQ